MYRVPNACRLTMPHTTGKLRLICQMLQQGHLWYTLTNAPLFCHKDMCLTHVKLMPFFVFCSTFICHPGICLKSLILYYGGLTGQEMLSGNDEDKESGVGKKASHVRV